MQTLNMKMNQNILISRDILASYILTIKSALLHACIWKICIPYMSDTAFYVAMAFLKFTQYSNRIFSCPWPLRIMH